MNINTLNTKSRSFLLDHSISRKNAGIVAMVTGFINSNEYDSIMIERELGSWYIVGNKERILTANVKVDSFHLPAQIY